MLSRFENHDELDELITSWTREQDQIEAMHVLQNAGVIAAAVLNPKQVLLDPHLRERGVFDMIDQPDVGVRPVSRQLGAKFSAFEPDSARPAPKLGEHNREILQGLLGLTDEDLARLEEQKVIGDTPEGAVPLRRDAHVRAVADHVVPADGLRGGVGYGLPGAAGDRRDEK